MDFKTQVAGVAGLAGVASDALLVLVAAGTVPDTLEAPLADVLQAAVKDGDFAFKPGQHLLARRVAGVKAPRVAFVHAGDGSVKALRKALAVSLALLKSSNVQRLSVVLAGARWTAGLAEALVLAISESTYTYRARKPRARRWPAGCAVARPSLRASTSRVNVRIARATSAPRPIWPSRPS